MQREEPRKCDHSNAVFPAQQTREIRTQQRGSGGNIRRHDGTPVGTVVPGEQVTGQPISQRQQQQDDADHPGGFARFFVSAEQKDLGHVEHDDHD